MTSLSLFTKSSGQITREGLSIAVVIPCFNVQDHIIRVVRSLPEEVNHIILVNDASKDQTGKIIASLVSERVRVIELYQNLGVGGAVKKGFDEAVRLGADIIVKMDGDGQMDPRYLPALIQPIALGKADYTKGNRFLHTHQIRSMPLIRRIGNIGLSFLVKTASGYWNIFDPTNGYTAISSKVYDMLDPDRIANRYYFETSMLVELGRRRAVVRDVSIPACYGDEKSSLSELKTLFEFPPRLLRDGMKRLIYQYYIRDFSAVSLFLLWGVAFFVFGSIWSIYHWMISGTTGITASTGTVMVGVLPLILGIQFLLQAAVMDIQNVPSEVIHTESL